MGTGLYPPGVRMAAASWLNPGSHGLTKAEQLGLLV